MQRERISTNVLAEGLARIITFAGSLVSSTVLYRSVQDIPAWSGTNLATVNLVTRVFALILPFVLLGISGAVFRIVAEYSNDRKKLGHTIGLSLMMVTLIFIIISVLSIVFGLDLLLLSTQEIDLTTNEIRLFWFTILIMLLPSAYTQIIRSSFSGMQVMTRSLILDVVSNTIKISVLLYFYIFQTISVLDVIWLNVSLFLITAILGISILQREMKRKNIPWGFKPDRELVRKISRLLLVFFTSSLVLAVMNAGTVVLTAMFGSPNDVNLYVNAQGITVSARSILSAPVTVLGAVLAAEYSLGKMESVRAKFKDGYRMIIPIYTFSFVIISAFSWPITRLLYGAVGVETVPYLILLSFNLIFVTIPGINGSLLVGLDDARGILYCSIVQLFVQVSWILIAMPILGVWALAMMWVGYIPYIIWQTFYMRKKHNIYTNPNSIIGHFAVGLIFALILNVAIALVINFLISLVIAPVVAAALSLLLIPFIWYLYLGVMFGSGLFSQHDLDNIRIFLKRIPPAWWISKPYLNLIESKLGRKESSHET